MNQSSSQPHHTTDITSINPPHEARVSDQEDLPMTEGGDMTATNKNQEQPPLRQFTRNKKQPEWFVANEALVDIQDTNDLIMDAHIRDPDTMYYHEAMREPYIDQFLQAVDKEVNTQIESDVIRLVDKEQVPLGTKVFAVVWALRRKKKFLTGKISKYKARMNLDGSKQSKGVHYDQSYAPVVTWHSIQLMLALDLLNGWHKKKIDYVVAYPQAPV